MIKKGFILGISMLIASCSITPHHAVSTNDLKYLRSLPADEVNQGPLDSSDWTPLHVAAAQNKAEAMDILLAKGANPSAYSSTMGVSPIHLAVANGHLNIVEKLLDLKVDINVKNKAGGSPLELSIMSGNIAIFNLLMKSNVDIEQKNSNGISALYTAIGFGRLSMAQDLISAGSNVNTIDNNGDTPLITSVFNQDLRMVNLLIEASADLNHQNNFGDTALHWAASKKNPEILKLLIDSGARTSIRNSSGKTARDLLGGSHSLISLFPTSPIEMPTSPEKEAEKQKPEPVSKTPSLSGTGSSFFVNNQGGLITNFHVIDKCREIRIFNNSKEFEAKAVHVDYKNDLAYLVAPNLAGKTYASIASEQQQLGEQVVVLGFPLTGLMGNSIKLTDGSLSALTGLGGDSSLYQISAPIQAGNSGGPVFNEKGQVIGVASSSLSAAYMLKSREAIPQNVNFAVKSTILSGFMTANQIPFDAGKDKYKAKTPKEVFAQHSDSVAMVLCYQ